METQNMDNIASMAHYAQTGTQTEVTMAPMEEEKPIDLTNRACKAEELAMDAGSEMPIDSPEDDVMPESCLIDEPNVGAARFYYHSLPSTSNAVPYGSLSPIQFIHQRPPHATSAMAAAAAAAATSSNPTGSSENKENGDDKLMAGNNEYEVMRAAKALFSKKTRTLYHWMYPNRSKFQLKSAVNHAWDAMAVTEKQFYVSQARNTSIGQLIPHLIHFDISQVLGKFGCVENRLMINPQLGFVPPTPSAIPVQVVHTPNIHAHLATLQNNRLSAVNMPAISRRRRGRPRTLSAKPKYRIARANIYVPTHLMARQVESDIEDIHKQLKGEVADDGTVDGAAPTAEEFTDDPELRKELDKFEWALHMAE